MLRWALWRATRRRLRNSKERSTLSTWSSSSRPSSSSIKALICSTSITSARQASLDILASLHVLVFFLLNSQQLSFWCHFFVWFPTSVCALGVFLLITAMFSIGVANQPNSNNLGYRILLGLIAVLYCVAFLGTIFVIFCTVKLEGCIQYSDPPADTVLNVRLWAFPPMQSWNHFLLQHLKQYGKEKTVTDDWDKLQRDLRWKRFLSQTFVSFARASKLIYKNRSESLLSLAVCYMYVICIEPSAATHFFRKMAQCTMRLSPCKGVN